MGSLVAVRLPPGPAFLEAWDQTWSAGDALLPLAHDAPDVSVSRIVEELRPAALIVPPPGHPDRTRVIRLDDALPVEDGTGLVVATSGSTGPPKGVVLSRPAIEAAVAASLERLAARDGAAWLSCLPWHHTAGLLTVLRSRARGAEPIVHAEFDVEAVRADVDRARFVSLVPTQLRRLLDAGIDLSPLDAVLLGGAAAPASLLDEATRAGIRVVTSYGLTETCGGCVYDGVPLRGVTVGLDDEGGILVHGPVLCDGYRDGTSGRVEPLEEMITLDETGFANVQVPGPGWFATEDLGRIDNGRLEVLGRRDDIIITGGENISADAVRHRLVEHPAIHDALVVGVPDPEWGTRVAAGVVSRDPRPTQDELREHVRETLGAAAAPRQIVFVAAIPHTTLGKPDRAGLLKLL